ncbi:exopolysaccharide biosynthesis polyprenyl glycosylphosphotransferase [Cyclobacterium marinum]|uniref:Exopolysaccharide biosynthesis polyprenyl glycosylphosphotransferase n=1 Tax=Cyclobacterium marinum (strain ATCC 25205 / DSM 745 / LMG 13164 / NCIMB 1802) TaxID=880070 RepID=G0J606_CYCMS|nr:exopolysaccharide biosynthesis polyprenyl glycosylphosphotransferase [Cyclobacterium marinum]AEL26069.1 exopolysaccharide biosynthesis polyprenyl glycosylphosphotransferase [Cyclobacterium marinum DSM 745]MBI0399432.1 exopolysaccharide biosynthesis polyprenyl glycosylphosphotransferase [Cyclobacterium marinum]
MAKRFYKYFPWLFIAVELLFIFILLGLLTWANSGVVFFSSGFWFDLGLLGLVWVMVVWVRKDYKLARTSVYWDTLKQFLVSYVWGVLVFFILREHLSFSDANKLDFYLYPLALFLVGFFRVAVHMALRRYRISGRNYRKAVILGKNEWSSQLARTLIKNKAYGIKLLGFFDDKVLDNQVLGDFDSFFNSFGIGSLDIVYLSQEMPSKLVQRIVDHADEHHFKVKIIPGPALQWNKKLTFSSYGQFVVVNLNEIPLDRLGNQIFKRVFDVIFSLFVIVFVFSWLMPIIAFLIKLESRGPVFFFQKRTGVNNKEFTCIKFRTMFENPFSDTLQASKDDPRVTRVGKVLRRFSLDELPQFINVLKNDMSVVGPRPHTVPMNEDFKQRLEKYNNRHCIKPGITGLAQVLGYRGEIINHWQIKSRVKLDYFYVRNWSFLLDIKIVLKTLNQMFRAGETAY